MKKNSIVICIYATLLLVGGLMGFIKASSMVSLIMAGSFACVLFVLGYFVGKGYQWALTSSVVLQSILFLFFAYRFSLSYKFMPAGMMMIMTTISIGYLFSQSKCLWCKKNNLSKTS